MFLIDSKTVQVAGTNNLRLTGLQSAGYLEIKGCVRSLDTYADGWQYMNISINGYGNGTASSSSNLYGGSYQWNTSPADSNLYQSNNHGSGTSCRVFDIPNSLCPDESHFVFELIVPFCGAATPKLIHGVGSGQYAFYGRTTSSDTSIVYTNSEQRSRLYYSTSSIIYDITFETTNGFAVDSWISAYGA